MVPVVSLDMQASFMREVKDITDLIKGNAFPVKAFPGCTVIDFSTVEADDVTALSVKMEGMGLRGGPGKRPAGADDDLVPSFDRFPDRDWFSFVSSLESVRSVPSRSVKRIIPF